MRSLYGERTIPMGCTSNVSIMVHHSARGRVGLGTGKAARPRQTDAGMRIGTMDHTFCNYAWRIGSGDIQAGCASARETTSIRLAMTMEHLSGVDIDREIHSHWEDLHWENLQGRQAKTSKSRHMAPTQCTLQNHHQVSNSNCPDCERPS